MNHFPGRLNASTNGRSSSNTLEVSAHAFGIHCEQRAITTALQVSDPCRTSILNQHVVSKEYSGQPIRHKRQVLIKETQVIDSGAFEFEDQKEAILALFSQYQLKIENRVEALRPYCHQEASLCPLAQTILHSITVNIRQIQRATSLQDIRPILDKLQNLILDASIRIQTVASPPLLSKFVNLRFTIFLKFSKSDFEDSPWMANKNELSIRIQRIIGDLDRFQNADVGSLSSEFVQKLKWGYDQRKNYALVAKCQIERARNNEEIFAALDVLRRSILRIDHTLRSVLRSPQRLLQEQVFTFLGKLHAIRRELGDRIQTS